MIHNKLEVRQVIHSLNEIEKLKLLLFDEDQYKIFEHIPKPYLIDCSIANKLDENEAQSPQVSVTPARSKSKTEIQTSEKRRQEFLMSNQSFWRKNLNRSKKMHNFSQALDSIKNKPELSIIDKRLLQIVNDFSGGISSFN